METHISLVVEIDNCALDGKSEFEAFVDLTIQEKSQVENILAGVLGN